jgi:hypothetical protein
MRMALVHSTVVNTGFRVRGRVSSNLSYEVAIYSLRANALSISRRNQDRLAT